MIETTLSKQQAEALFQEEGIMFDNMNVLPVFRAVELFGKSAGEWIERNIGIKGNLQPGQDHNSRGACSEEAPLIDYLYHSGFFKLVEYHNYCVVAQRYKTTEGGRVWREIWEARCARLNALDAEEDRKREERKAKRAAARKAKLEAQKAAEATA